MARGGPPRAELVAQRLRQLREYRWSSYRTYAGYSAAIPWLWRQPLDRLCGGTTESDRRAFLRDYTEQPLRQGVIERPWDRLVAGLVLGSQIFARKLTQQIRGNRREQPALRQLAPAVTWEQIVQAVEWLKEETWDRFVQRHGDWGRDAALWLGRRHARLTLAQLGQLAGKVDYAAVGQALSRFNRRLDRNQPLRKCIHRIENQLSKIEM